MNLKRIEIFGFKSFADKLEINFDAGITGIVGPNGCGKSNVSDSIRWVLGEQSSKSLRGQSMTDVIFFGTEKRKSLSYCEVSLVFDNSMRTLPLDYNEIVISRKLYRDGGSVYSLNRTECRLKDITSLLHDAGIGKEGYSIIGQGRIGEILSAKPDERRAVFEEAAGIIKYKKSKDDSERKLQRTLENLDRVNDIISEIERQLEPLSRQAENARKYLTLKERQKHLDINNYIIQYETNTEAKAVITTRLNAIIEEWEQKNQTYESAVTDLTEGQNQLNSIDSKVAVLRDRLLDLTVGKEKQEGEIKLLNEKLTHLKNQNEKLAKDIERYTDELSGVKGTAERKQRDAEAKSTLLTEYNKNLEKLNDSYLAVTKKLTVGEGALESNQEQMMDAMNRLTEIKSNMSRLLAERSSLTESVKDLENRISTINNKITDDEVRAILLKNEVEKATQERDKQAKTLDSLTEEYNECQSRMFEHSKHLEQLTVKNNTMAARHKMLADIQSEGGGFSYAVKKLLAATQINHFVKDKIEGVVAKLIQVPEQYEAAIETALQAAVQNVVTRTEEDAQYLIEYLKSNDYGRATFLPMSAISPRALDPQYQQKIKRTGVYGIAADLIKYDKKYDNIIRSLLGSTVVAENLSIAIKLARECRFAFKIVTLEGDVVNPHGSMSGGSRKSELANILAHEREFNKLTQSLETLRKELMYAESEKLQLSKNQEQRLNDIKALSEKVHALDITIATNKEKHDKYVNGINEQQRELFILTEEVTRKSTRFEEIDRDIKSVDTLEATINSKKEEASSSMKQQNLEFDKYKRERDDLHEKITDAKVKIAALESDLNAVKNEINRLSSENIELTQLIEDANAQISANNETLSTAEVQMSETKAQYSEEDDGDIDAIRAELETLKQEKYAIQSQLVEKDSVRSQFMKIIQQLTDAKFKEELNLHKVDTDLEEMREKVFEEYQLDYEGCVPFRAEEHNLAEGIAESARIKRQIQNLGYINVNAIEDCQTLATRHNEYVTQRDDLIKSEAQTREIIGEITATMTGRFVKYFELIRVNFMQTYKEMFGGGTADLILADPNNVLECGIDIIANPPGKKLKNNMQLSGGEKALTAIAVLFAILKLKPMPFCVLDEIEAALDDANADRFARYLNRFSKETQFIVITHRKPTMELAHALYGVTMEEKGVSKMVSVKLAEATRFAETV